MNWLRSVLALLAAGLPMAWGQVGAPLAHPSPLLPEPIHAGQGREPEKRWQWEPVRTESPAWLLALWGESPYAEVLAAGMPLPPSPAEVAAMPAVRRLQEQVALKKVWLERLIRAQEERNRVTPENHARAALMARRHGAPAEFVEAMERQAAGAMPPRLRYVTEASVQEMLASYGVDELAIRLFVEGAALPPAQLREVAARLPLPALFNLPDPGLDSLSPQTLSQRYVEFLALRRDVAAAWRGVVDYATAEAAAETLLPLLARYMAVMEVMLAASEEARATALAPYARYAFPVNEACAREGARLREKKWFGSARLQALDYWFR